MELTVFERIILLNLLPKEGDFLTLKIVRKMREDLSFSEAEHKDLRFDQTENNIKWNQAADKPKVIDFGEKATDIIVGILKKLDETKKLTEQQFSLFEKFVMGT